MTDQTTSRYNLTIPVKVTGLANAIDDTAETIRGRIDHDRAHSDETRNTLGDRWNSLQAFMGGRS